MGKGGGGNSTTTTTVDPASQNFINRQRGQAEQAANVATGSGPFFTGPLTQTPAEMAQAFFNPFQDQVIGGIRGEFDHLRNQAVNRTNQEGTQLAGGPGGSRAAVLAGSRMGALDRAQTSQIGQFLNQGFNTAQGRGTQFAEHQRQLQERQMQEPLFRQQQALNFMNMGMGPVGQTQRTEQDPSLIDRAFGSLPGMLGGGMIGGLFG